MSLANRRLTTKPRSGRQSSTSLRREAAISAAGREEWLSALASLPALTRRRSSTLSKPPTAEIGRGSRNPGPPLVQPGLGLGRTFNLGPGRNTGGPLTAAAEYTPLGASLRLLDPGLFISLNCFFDLR